ncbi:MAG: asparagine synthetase B, partial [Alphaproteobacteria bacterium]|nr:asparagine synthetase B [Alphaproteobacteria bacterium]
GGYPSFTDLPRWRRQFGLLARIPFLGCMLRIIGSELFPAAVKAQPKAFGVLHYASSLPGAYMLRRGLFLPYEMKGLVGAEMARDGLARLRPLRRMAQQLDPDPGTMNGRICVLESENYMRNQLLRDADWAGMAHSLEIRVPLVDWHLATAIAPYMRSLTAGAGKQALARAPVKALPDVVCQRAKTGFGVPTGAWMANVDGMSASSSKGAISRHWSKRVLGQAF